MVASAALVDLPIHNDVVNVAWSSIAMTVRV